MNEVYQNIGQYIFATCLGLAVTSCTVLAFNPKYFSGLTRALSWGLCSLWLGWVCFLQGSYILKLMGH